MTTTETPEGWEDIDHAIYDHRIRQHKVWRDVGAAVGYTAEGARKRFYRKMALVELVEIEDYRAEENEKHDLREARLMELVETAIKAGDFKAAVSAFRAMDNVSRSRAMLNNLNVAVSLDDVSVEEAEAALGKMLDVYLQGLADGAAAGTTEPTNT